MSESESNFILPRISENLFRNHKAFFFHLLDLKYTHDNKINRRDFCELFQISAGESQLVLLKISLFFSDAAAQSGPGPPHS
jgi:hypothetical protein